jgi:hypothetical protein
MIMQTMKKYFLYIFFLGCLLGVENEVLSQTYFGYQTPGIHTFFFSISWQEKPHLGVGYNFRAAGNTFTDIGAELRFPTDEIFKFTNPQIIAGIYSPLRLKRSFGAIGLHLRIDRESTQESVHTHYGVAASFLPTLAYAASLTDGAYNTAALRITYNPILFTQIRSSSGEKSTHFLSGHRIQFGGHLDMHLERTLTVAADGAISRILGAKTDFMGREADSWNLQGAFFWGSTYHLKRW